MPPTAGNDRRRQKALAAAEAELAARGFAKNEEGRWVHAEAIEDGVLALQVALSENPSRSLPTILVDRKQLPRRVPHVEKDGRICLPASERVLLNASDPAGIVSDAVDKAKNTVLEGLSGEHNGDLRREFMAYWADDAPRILWPLPVPVVAQEMCLARLRGTAASDTLSIAAASYEDADAWAKRVGREVASFCKAYFIPLSEMFDPPDFENWTFEEFFERLDGTMSAEAVQAFMEWMSDEKAPVTLFFSMPSADAQGVVIAGATFPKSRSPRQKRPMNASDDIANRLGDKIERLCVERGDPGFLTGRAGSSEGLHSQSVAIVGCGAVGSQVAIQLALLGVGHLKLIDGQHLEIENIHRHALGLQYLRKSKAEALALELTRRYPNIQTEARALSVEQVDAGESRFLRDSDLIVFATGDENLELQFNSILKGGPPRVHTWVEPLGIGGHAIAVGMGTERGCYECLYLPLEEVPVYNSAAFASARQTKEFGRSMAGCAGTFIPFSALDAIRTATEATDLAAGVLEGRETRPVLVSWFGSAEVFRNQGFNLAAHAEGLQPGARLRRSNFERGDCEGCGAE